MTASVSGPWNPTIITAPISSSSVSPPGPSCSMGEAEAVGMADGLGRGSAAVELEHEMLNATTARALDEQRLPEKLHATFVGMAAARTREMLGPERVDWLTSLPLEWRAAGVGVVHATPGDCWAIVAHDAPDDNVRDVFGAVGVPTAVYGHIHHAYVRELGGLTVANSGSVSLSLDGDPRACYALIEDGRIEHRRVEYDIKRVASEFEAIDYPNAKIYAAWLRSGEDRSR